MPVPSPLAHASAVVLEFERLREMLLGYAASPLGKEWLAELAPSGDREWIARQQQLTAELRPYLRAGGRFDFYGLADVRALVSKAQIEGAALETSEIRDLLAVVDRAAEFRETALHPPAAMDTPWPAVRELSEQIAD